MAHVSDLRIVPVDGEAMLQEWRHVHNVIVPPAAMDLGEVRKRSRRHRLRNGYVGDVLVGCSTVRPPAGEDAVATVIARVLPEYRGHGYGTRLFRHGLAYARVLGAKVIETCVSADNEDGLRFAKARGFVETDRYVVEGGPDLWVDLRLA
ncbi:GNAT family N-acetyltransferase [Streptomyces chartreusis]